MIKWMLCGWCVFLCILTDCTNVAILHRVKDSSVSQPPSSAKEHKSPSRFPRNALSNLKSIKVVTSAKQVHPLANDYTRSAITHNVGKKH